MDKQFNKGDSVEWNTPQGKTTGKVLAKVTSDQEAKKFHVTASKSDPKYKVKSAKTGKEAIHKAESLS